MLPAFCLTVLSLAWPILARVGVSEACGNIGMAHGTKAPQVTREFTFLDRTVLVKVPQSYNTSGSSPLILAYHDRSMNAESLETIADFNHRDYGNNAIVAYLTPTNMVWITDPLTRWSSKEESWDSDGQDAANDLDYTRMLLDQLQKDYCLDLHRIYATGLGTGGGLVHQLACHTHLSRRIAALAIVNGAIYRPRRKDSRMWGKCLNGRRPIPILSIHGSNNRYYPLEDNSIATNIEVKSSEEWMREWTRINGCGEIKREPRISEQSEAVVITQMTVGQRYESITYGGLVQKTAYRCGRYKKRSNFSFKTEEKDPRKISLVHYAVQGAGHGWPRKKGAVQTEVSWKDRMVKPLGGPNFDASIEILNFFRTHKLPSDQIVHDQARELLHERGADRYEQGSGNSATNSASSEHKEL